MTTINGIKCKQTPTNDSLQVNGQWSVTQCFSGLSVIYDAVVYVVELQSCRPSFYLVRRLFRPD